jgi:membrane-bound ClpP family serine protease
VGALLAACHLEVGLLARAASRDVIVVPIQGTVDDGMAHLVARAVDDANASHATGLVLDINTTGGLVSSAFEIRTRCFAPRCRPLPMLRSAPSRPGR